MVAEDGDVPVELRPAVGRHGDASQAWGKATWFTEMMKCL